MALSDSDYAERLSKGGRIVAAGTTRGLTNVMVSDFDLNNANDKDVFNNYVRIGRGNAIGQAADGVTLVAIAAHPIAQNFPVLSALANSLVARNYQPAVNAIINNAGFNAAVAQILAQDAAGLARIQERAANLTAVKLQALVGAERVRADHITVKKIIDASLFDTVVAQLLAQDTIGLISIQTAAAALNPIKLQALVGAERVRADQITVKKIIDAPAFNTIVAQALAQDTIGLASIQAAAAASNSTKLQAMVNATRIRVNQTTVNAIIAAPAFDVAVAQVLAQDATGLAKIRVVAPSLLAPKLQILIETSRVRSDQGTVNTIISAAAFDANLAQILAQDEIGLTKIRESANSLKVTKLQIMANAAHVRADQSAVIAIIVAPAFDSTVAQILAQDPISLKWIQTSAAILWATKLQAIIDAKLARNDQITVEAIIEAKAFDTTVAQKLAQDADGLAKIRAAAADLASIKLQIILGATLVRADQTTVNAIIKAPAFDATVAQKLAQDAAGLAKIRAAAADDLTALQLQIMLGAALVRADQATVNAIIKAPAFDATVAQILAQDADGLAKIRAAIADNLTALQLQIMLDATLVRADQTTVNAIIEAPAFDATVAQILAQDTIGLIKIKTRAASLTATKLQAIADSALIRADQDTVNAIIQAPAFDTNVAQILAKDTAGLAKIQKAAADLNATKLQTIVGSTLVRSDQATVNAIIAAPAFNTIVAENLAQDTIGLLAIEKIPSTVLSVMKLQQLLNSPQITAVQSTVNSIMGKVPIDIPEISALVMKNTLTIDIALIQNSNTPSSDLTTIINRRIDRTYDLIALCHPNLSPGDKDTLNTRNTPSFTNADFLTIHHNQELCEKIRENALLGNLAPSLITELNNGGSPAILNQFYNVINKFTSAQQLALAPYVAKSDSNALMKTLTPEAAAKASSILRNNR